MLQWAQNSQAYTQENRPKDDLTQALQCMSIADKTSLREGLEVYLAFLQFYPLFKCITLLRVLFVAKVSFSFIKFLLILVLTVPKGILSMSEISE